MCCLIFKKIKNYKLVIHVAVSSSNNSIRKHFLLRLPLWPTISRLSWKRTSGQNHEILSEDHVDCDCGGSFSERDAQIVSTAQRPVLSDECSSSIACHVESNHHCTVNDSKYCRSEDIRDEHLRLHLFSDRNHNVINSPRTSSRTSSCTSQHVTYKT